MNLQTFPETPFLAINSEFDAPSARMLVIVHAITDSDRCSENAVIEYCSQYTRQNAKWRRSFKVSVKQVFPIEWFGQRAEFDCAADDSPRVRCVTDEGLQPIAIYSDGEPRVWESRHRTDEIWALVDRKLASLVQACVRLQDIHKDAERMVSPGTIQEIFETAGGEL